MKVWIESSRVNPNKISGKALFGYRLGQALEKKGVTVVDGTATADVSINIIRIKHRKSKVKILRLDGVWHNTGQDYIKKNEAIQRSIRKADGIVFQSQFSSRMGERYLGTPLCPVKVIYNGSDPDFYEKADPILPLHKHLIVAFSKWRPHKRLRDIIKSFLLAEIPDSVLYVAGDLDNSGISSKQKIRLMGEDNIRFIGKKNQRELASYLKVAKASLHLCWFDSCPNSVVEAIVAGVPVVCNNVGGTPELVEPSGGYVCDIDRPYDMEPVDLYHPPEIDRWKVASQLIKAVNEQPVVKKDHVLIDNIADQYLKFMEELL